MVLLPADGAHSGALVVEKSRARHSGREMRRQWGNDLPHGGMEGRFQKGLRSGRKYMVNTVRKVQSK
jgi:hypothetical protein